jgi:tRNA dimethylallyltransferase
MVQEIIIVCGPTAVGKTSVSIELAKRFEGEIVSADSQQVWRGMNIGTAKANLTERSEVPHHLIDIAEPNEHFDAACFVELADKAIEDISSRGKRAFVVGGTGMYLRLLVNGLCEAPPQDPEVREQIEVEVEARGLQKMHDRLMEIDPESALGIHPNDHTRIVRALEIYELSGTPASEFRKVHGYGEKRYDALKIGLNIEREELYRRVNERIDHMLGQGLLDEVKVLLEKYGHYAQGLKAVGYREFVQHFRGESSLERAIELAKRNSRRFAKRQLTWFRSDDEIKWFKPDDMEGMCTHLQRQ